MYEIVLSKQFKKESKKLVKNNNQLYSQLGKTLNLLNKNINSKSLRIHKLSGTDYWSVSINSSYRIKIKIEDKYIFCVKFGKHEDVY